MAITPLPTPPSRNDPTNFSARGDAFLGALPAFATEANALAVDVNADAAATALSASTASAAAIAATAAANVSVWVSGTTYTAGTVVYSPVTYFAYRRKTGGAGTTDPSLDTTNWALSGGTGNLFAESPGTNGQVLKSLGPGLNPAFQDAASSSIQEFSTSGTWTKPAGANFVQVEVWGAGGGGASGDRTATSTNRFGGAGGGGGGYISKIFKASELASSVLVTIGAGGTGGAARTEDGTAGTSGTNGGNSTFGSLIGYGASFGRASGAAAGGGGGTQGASVGTSTGGAPRLAASGTLVQSFGGGDGGTSGVSGQSSSFGGGGGSAGMSPLSPGTSSWGGAGGCAGGGIDGANTLFNAAEAAQTVPGYFGFNGTSGLAYAAQTNVVGSGMAFGNGTFVQGAGIGFISTSTNGTTWNIVPAVSGISFLRFLYDGTRWIAYNTNRVFTSTDLVTWRCVASIGSAFNGIAHFNDLYVSVGASGVIRTSPNLFNWSTQTSGTAVTLNDVIHDGTRWIVVGASGVSLTSTAATTWTVVTTASSGNWSRVATSGSVIVATASVTPFAWRSTDNGATWSAVATTLTSNGYITHENSLFVWTNTLGALHSSTDGNAWTSRTTPAGSSLTHIAYGGGIWAVSESNLSTTAAIISTDVITWTARTATSLAAGAQSGGAGGIACGGGGGAVSTNGTNSGAGGAGGSGYCRVYTW